MISGAETEVLQDAVDRTPLPSVHRQWHGRKYRRGTAENRTVCTNALTAPAGTRSKVWQSGCAQRPQRYEKVRTAVRGCGSGNRHSRMSALAAFGKNRRKR